MNIFSIATAYFTLLLLCLPVTSMANDNVQKFPDVIAVNVSKQGDTFTFAVTLSSPYDTPQRYADAFRVLDESGNELGVRILWHDHANEQPFTRSLTGVVVADSITRVIIQGRDQKYGWGGQTMTVDLPN